MILNTRLLSISIGLLIVASAFSQLLVGLGGGGVAKLLQIIVMLIFIIAIFHAGTENKLGKNSILPVLLLSILVVNAIWAVLSGGEIKYVFITFLQLSFFYLCLLFFESQSLNVLTKAVDVVEKVVFAALLLSIVEFLLPKVWVENILFLILGGVPVSYISREFSDAGLRLGSFFLSPLTFSFSCVLLLVLADVRNRKYSKIVYVFLVLCKVKTGFIGGLLYLTRHVMFRWIKWLFLLLLIGILLTPLFFDGIGLLMVPSDSPYKSLSFHFVGLVSGIEAGYHHMFTGNGLGNSGYLVYLSAKESLYVSSPMHYLSPMLNGNESTFGVIAFQMGLVFLLIHVYLFFKYLSDFTHASAISSASFVLFIMIFQALSESSLTLFVSLVIAITLAWLRKVYEKKTEDRGVV